MNKYKITFLTISSCVALSASSMASPVESESQTSRHVWTSAYYTKHQLKQEEPQTTLKRRATFDCYQQVSVRMFDDEARIILKNFKAEEFDSGYAAKLCEYSLLLFHKLVSEGREKWLEAVDCLEFPIRFGLYAKDPGKRSFKNLKTDILRQYFSSYQGSIISSEVEKTSKRFTLKSAQNVIKDIIDPNSDYNARKEFQKAVESLFKSLKKEVQEESKRQKSLTM